MNRRSFFAALAVAPLVPLENTQPINTAVRMTGGFLIDASIQREQLLKYLSLMRSQMKRVVYGTVRHSDGTIEHGHFVYDPREGSQP